jgi:hypothetical protein
MRTRKKHHEISDAVVVATIVLTGMLVFVVVLLGALPPATATVEPTPEGIAVSVDITPQPLAWDEQSPCWHPPFLPDQPHWTTCLFKTNA